MPKALQLSDVSVSYGRRTVAHQVTFHADFGSIVGLLGSNGAGKTSLLKAASGLIEHQGQILIEGLALDSLSRTERAKKLAYVPQRTLLSAALRVEEVVAQGRYCHRSAFSSSLSKADHCAIEQALHQVDATALRERLFTQLSGGEQRRVLLARALCTEARIILFDEPTASLDIAHALSFFGSIRALADKGHCIVCVLHNLDDAARFCDAALLLKEGKALAFGPAASVIQEDRVREAYGVNLVQNGGFSYELPRSFPSFSGALPSSKEAAE